MFAFAGWKVNAQDLGSNTGCSYHLLLNMVQVQQQLVLGEVVVWLQVAAQQLSVGVTTLKKICRSAKVTRWPFRKRTSIERLIERTEYFLPLVGDDAELQEHIAALQALLEHKDDFKVLTCLH